jgi:hypothetical protein
MLSTRAAESPALHGDANRCRWPVSYSHMALSNQIAKKGSGRSIPLHPLLQAELVPLQR